jgi:hypothetical protein
MANGIASVEHHEIEVVAGALGKIKQRRNVGFDCSVGSESLGFATAIGNGAGDLRDFRFRAAGNDDPMTFTSKPTSDRGAKPLLRADPYNDRRALMRGH